MKIDSNKTTETDLRRGICCLVNNLKENVMVHQAFGDRHGGRSYRIMVGPASLPATFQTGYTAFSANDSVFGVVLWK
jgi:hypothetical protein